MHICKLSLNNFIENDSGDWDFDVKKCGMTGLTKKKWAGRQDLRTLLCILMLVFAPGVGAILTETDRVCVCLYIYISHKLHKIFNRNNLKVSYSCTTNMANIIKNHNGKILNERDEIDNRKMCICRNKDLCPLDGKCLTSKVIYVVVQFCFWFNLDFPLLFSMLIYDNEYQTKENPN